MAPTRQGGRQAGRQAHVGTKRSNKNTVMSAFNNYLVGKTNLLYGKSIPWSPICIAREYELPIIYFTETLYM